MNGTDHAGRCMATDDCGRDAIDHEAASDPALDRLPAQLPERDAARVLAILDELKGGEG